VTIVLQLGARLRHNLYFCDLSTGPLDVWVFWVRR
jgi:hypothetical protein